MDAYALALKFQTEGFDDVFRKLDQVDARGKRVAETGTNAGVSIERIGHKAAGVAIALSGMETVGVSAMEKIAHGATNIGFMFGPEGAIVGALGIVAVMMVNVFTQARKEMEATDKRARDLLRSLSLETGVSTTSRLYGGDQFAKTGSPEQLGLAGARARKAALEAEIAASKITTATRTGYQTIVTAPQATIDELEKLTDWLKEADPLYKRVVARTNELAAAAVEVNQNLIQIAETERKRKEAEDAYVPPVRGKMPGMATSMEASANFANRDAMEEWKLNKARQLEPIKARAMIVLTQAQKDLIAMVDNTAEMIRDSIASTIGSAIIEGFRAAFSGKGIGGVFKGLANSILSGLGSVFMQMGQKMVAASALMMAFQKAIVSFFPGGGLVAGLALMALGGGMMAAGGGMGSGGGGAGSGGYGGDGGFNSRQEETTRVRLMPSWASANGVEGRESVTVNATIIGPNDPQAQRQITALISNAARRGLTTHGGGSAGSSGTANRTIGWK